MRMKHLFVTLALGPLAVAVAQADQLSDIMAKKSMSCGVYADVPPFPHPIRKPANWWGWTSICARPWPRQWGWNWSSNRCLLKHGFLK